MNSIDHTIAGIAASRAPYVAAVTFCIEDGRIVPYLLMTDDENAPPFANVVEILPGLAERLDAEIRAADAGLYVPLSVANYVGEDGELEPGVIVLAERSAPGGSPH